MVAHLVCALDAMNLVYERGDLLETFLACDAVHAEEALASSHVLVERRRVLLLPGRVQNVKQAGLVVDSYLVRVRVRLRMLRVRG